MQRGMDYEPLREALKEQDFLKADDIHRKKLIEVAGEAAQERGWVYFSEVCSLGSINTVLAATAYRALTCAHAIDLLSRSVCTLMFAASRASCGVQVCRAAHATHWS